MQTEEIVMKSFLIVVAATMSMVSAGTMETERFRVKSGRSEQQQEAPKCTMHNCCRHGAELTQAQQRAAVKSGRNGEAEQMMAKAGHASPGWLQVKTGRALTPESFTEQPTCCD